MKKWEYKAVSLRPTFNIGDFNVMGEEGWELVYVMQVPNLGTHKAIFKRQKETSDKDG